MALCKLHGQYEVSSFVMKVKKITCKACQKNLFFACLKVLSKYRLLLKFFCLQLYFFFFSWLKSTFCLGKNKHYEIVIQ